MSVQRVASRYAKALVDLAKDHNKLENIKNDIAGFLEVVKNRDFKLCLQSPIINTGTKSKIFRELFEGKVDKVTMAFFNIILNKGRESYLPEIASEFLEQYKAINGISTIRLVTAGEVDAATINAIKAKFETAASTRSKVEIVHVIDPALIGGFMVEFDDKLYDASVRHQLEQARKQFTSNTHIQNI